MNYYIEIKNRTFGPFTREQIDEKIAAGWLTRESKISYDGQNWKKADDAEELFPKAQQPSYSAPQNSNVAVEQTPQSREWYLSADGKTGSGPYTSDDIVSAFNAGKVNLDSLVWRNGEYARPIKKEPFFANLTSSFDAGSNIPKNDVFNASFSPNLSSNADLQFARTINARQFKAWFVGVLTFCFGVLTLIAILYLAFKSEFDEFGFPEFKEKLFGLRAGVCALGAFEILSLLFIIFQPQFLSSLWKSIPAEVARVKSVEAAGFLFIPFYNAYWIFVALYGCVCDVNKALKRSGSELENRHFLISEGIAVTYCVLLAPCLIYWEVFKTSFF